MTTEQQKALTNRAIEAIRAAVKSVVDDHRRHGRPIVVWRDGKVVREMPAQVQAVHEETNPYGADRKKDAHED